MIMGRKDTNLAHLLDRRINEKFIERVAFTEKPEGIEKVSHVDI